MTTMNGTRAVSGYLMRRTRHVTWIDPEAGPDDEPFQAEIVRPLNGELSDLPSGADVTFGDLYAAVSKFVVGWNALGLDEVTGDVQPILPPAEIGADAFMLIRPEIGEWLLVQIKHAHRIKDDLPKGSTPSSDTPAPAPATTSG